MRISALLIIAAAIGLSGCASNSSNDPESGSGGAYATSSSGGGSAGAPGPAPDAPAVHNRIRDTRVIFYDPRVSSALVIVNTNHSQRETLEGRMALSLGRSDIGYKVLSDLQVDALLESMKQYGASRIEEPWRSADDRYLRTKRGQMPGFRGIVVVENDGEKRKYVGLSPQGDQAKANRYQTFVNLKTLVAEWYRSVSHVELPAAGGPGISRPSGFDIPRSEERHRNAGTNR